VLSLEALSTDIARAACTDGTIYGTMTGGRKWTRLGALKGIRAIAYASLSEAMALVAKDGCAAQVVRSSDGGFTWKSEVCLPGMRAEIVTSSRNGWYAQVSGVVLITDDKGKTWANPA